LTQFKVKVINTETGKLVKWMTADTRRQAERLENGLNINLNHDAFHTEVEDLTPASASPHTPEASPGVPP
jgi:hypothetical protein